MAGLGNTGIKGFIGSAIFTGQKILKKGKEIPEMIEDFTSGFFGKGWKIWQWRPGKYKLEIDDLTVRGSLSVFELLIQKIRAVKGALAISQGSGKIESVTLSDDFTEYLITVEDDMSFTENDFILCQRWSAGVKKYHVMIDKIVDNVIHIPIFDEGFDLTYDAFDKPIIHNAPQVGDEIVQFGNLNNVNRQSAIYLHADETGQPAIDVMFNINSRDWSDNLKIRLGGDIPGTNGLKGFYVENGMIKGTQKDSNGNVRVTYALHPDGTAEFAGETVKFRPNGSGYIANGAISWSYNTLTKKYETNLNNVSLNWSNLDEDTQNALKPYIGEDGYWYIGGTKTTTKAEGKDGLDGVGTDGKDGKDGKDGLDGVGTDGKDGKDGIDGKDGKDGIGHDGENGLNGLTILKSEWDVGVKYYNEELKEPTLDENGKPINELRYLSVAMVKDDTMKSGWQAYKCLQTHDSTIDPYNGPNSDSGLWDKFDANISTIFTSLIIADRADIANFIFFDGNLISKAGVHGNGEEGVITGAETKAELDAFVPNIILDGNNGRLKANSASITGEINATSGVFSGYIQTPFKDLDDSDATSTHDAVTNTTTYTLGKDLNLNTFGFEEIILPDDISYAGSKLILLNSNFPPYTRTSMRFDTKIKVSSNLSSRGLGIGGKPKTAPLYEFVDPQQISIMGEIVELLGVERHFTTETSEVIHLTQWIVTSGWKANYEGF